MWKVKVGERKERRQGGRVRVVAKSFPTSITIIVIIILLSPLLMDHPSSHLLTPKEDGKGAG